MKKRLLLVLMTLLTTTAIWAAVGDTFTANTVEGVEMTFKVTNEGTKTCSVSSIPGGTSGAVTIPATANAYTVTAIGNYAFNNCSGLTSISIPSSVTSIGDFAFYYCNKLSTVKVEWSNPVSISSDVFSNNANMMLNVPVGTKETYAAASYWQDFNIVEGDIYLGVTIDGICYDLMEDGLKATVVVNTAAKYSGEITIPSSVSYEGKTYQVSAIGDRAFYVCSDLTSIIIPNSVTSIGSDAFWRCI